MLGNFINIDFLTKFSTMHSLAMENFFNYLKIDYCYNCKGDTQRDYFDDLKQDTITGEFFVSAECHTCKKIFIYVYERDRPKGTKFPSSMVVGGITTVRLVTVFPKYSVSKIDYVPNKIAESYNEALRCIDNNAPNGAVTMFRRALQQICVKKVLIQRTY